MKRVKGGSVEVTVTDKGSLKQLGKNARQTGKDVGSVAKNVQESDRRLKSLSNQTSNSTKAFSKQAQTIEGGLVPIYATLAAQVFAISAAYRFMQESANFTNLIEGQLAYGAMTGQMLNVLAGDIRNATQAQISFTEASQAAAIGQAAGLNAAQLTALGQAATNVSLALGRDVTDSFNRLVRGVTKAEPELLDELGIILRLDPALRNYATSIQKTKEQLNPFERSQAVVNEVLAQAESKFGAISKIMDPSAFAVGQFGQAFNDVLDDVKLAIGDLARTVLPFFSQNVTALIAALGTFSLSIIRTMLPDFDAISAKASQSANNIRRELAEAQTELAQLQKASALRTKKDAAAYKQTGAAEAMRGAKGIDFSTRGLSDAQVRAYLSNARRGRGLVKQMSEENARIFIGGLEKMDAANRRIQGKMVVDVKTAEQQKRIEQLKTFQKQETRALQSASFTADISKLAMRGLSAITRAGFVVMGLELVKAGIRQYVIGDEAKETQDAIDDFKKMAKQLENINKNLVKMGELRGVGAVASDFKQLATALSGINFTNLFNQFQQLDANLVQQGQRSNAFLNIIGQSMGRDPIGKFLGGVTASGMNAVLGLADYSGKRELAKQQAESFKGFTDSLKNLRNIATPEMREVINDLLTPKGLTQKNIDRLNALSDEYQKLNLRAKAFSETQKTLNQAMTAFVGKFAPQSAAMNFRTALNAQIDAADAERKILEKDIANFGGFEMVAMKMGDKDPEAIRLRNRYDNLVDQEKVNKAIGKILADNLDKERKLATTAAMIKAEKESIRQNGSIEAAEATKRLQVEEKVNKLDQHRLQIKIQEAIRDDESITKSQEQRDLLEFTLKLMGLQEKSLEKQIELEKEKFSIQKEAYQNQLRVQGGTIAGRFALGGFGFTKQGAAVAAAGQDEKRLNDYLVETFGALPRDDKGNIIGSYTDAQRKEAKSAVEEQETIFQRAKMNLDFIAAGMDRIGSAMTDGIANAIISVVDGTKSMKEAFSELAKSVIADLTKMAIRMFIMNALFPGSGTAMAALPTPGPMGRSGGVMSSPGYRSYASGGIATGPDSGYQATLHGTEAVVPLGNSRSIPVELKGAGGGVNNVTVNISTDGTVSTDSDAEETKAFGKQISNVVIREIEIQKRPGGLLAR
jgi:hypothetical protein